MEQDFHVDKILRLWQLKMYFQSRGLNILCIARFTCEGFLRITARGVFLPPGAVPFVLMYLCLKNNIVRREGIKISGRDSSALRFVGMTITQYSPRAV